MMLSTVISTGALRAGAAAATGDFDWNDGVSSVFFRWPWADGEEIERAASRQAARPTLIRFIDV
jgi:hypothetical protein